MIQDILPKHFNNQYKNIKPEKKDKVFCFRDGKVLAGNVQGEVEFPNYEMFRQQGDFIYLFSVDEEKYFLLAESNVSVDGEAAGFEYMDINMFRRAVPKYRAFAAITAYHLYNWYSSNRFCGKCGSTTKHDTKERMLRCDKCGNLIFPRINPAVIVGVTNGSKLLLTKYAGGIYKNYALVAGFAEIGETLEETVKREVMEEVGLKVKNIKYYKSQPWALSGSILSGFYCEVDGDDTITLQEEELSVGQWVEAWDIDSFDEGVSLTKEMIVNFRNSILAD